MAAADRMAHVDLEEEIAPASLAEAEGRHTERLHTAEEHRDKEPVLRVELEQGRPQNLDAAGVAEAEADSLQ